MLQKQINIVNLLFHLYICFLPYKMKLYIFLRTEFYLLITDTLIVLCTVDLREYR